MFQRAVSLPISPPVHFDGTGYRLRTNLAYSIGDVNSETGVIDSEEPPSDQGGLPDPRRDEGPSEVAFVFLLFPLKLCVYHAFFHFCFSFFHWMYITIFFLIVLPVVSLFTAHVICHKN